MIGIETEKFYHSYNRANGNEILFLVEENYRFFLQQWIKYIQHIVISHAYCLMPNHIHFLIQVKSDSKIRLFSDSVKNYDTVKKYLSKQFSNLFSSYTRDVNKPYNRKGGIFIYSLFLYEMKMQMKMQMKIILRLWIVIFVEILLITIFVLH